MGEAKQKAARMRAVMREAFLNEIDLVAGPTWDGEVALYQEVMALPMVRVPRASLGYIALLGMEPHECHLNVHAFTLMDVTRRSRRVTGWLCETTIPRLHSVLDQFGRGELVCITPHNCDVLCFRPDPYIVVGDDGIGRRDGRLAPIALRPDPPATIEAARQCIALVKKGVHFEELPEPLLQLVGVIRNSVEGIPEY
jgi:hypothetical protein